jgi:hypothetical protein
MRSARTMKVGLRELLRGSRFRLLTENPVVAGECTKSLADGQLNLRIVGHTGGWRGLRFSFA